MNSELYVDDLVQIEPKQGKATLNLITNVPMTPAKSKRAARRAIIAKNGGEPGSNDKVKGTVRCTSEGDLQYLMTEDPETWSKEVIPIAKMTASTNWETVGAAFHNDIRDVLIEEDNALGQYNHPRQEGLDTTDVTCYNNTQKSWGPNRSDWPEVLFRIYVDKTMGAKDKVEVWYCNDKLILDSDHHAMRVFDIPATISSQIEDFILMAMMHSDSRMKIFDIRGRMPNVARIAGKNGEKQENLKSLNGLSMMMTRFRLKAALLPRERRSGSREIEEGLKALLPPSCFRSSPPSTKSFGRLLTDEEVTKLQALNKGKFDYRKRGACGVSIATIPEDKKSSHDKKRDMALQEFDQLLSEVEDVIESMPRKKESRNGKEPESLSSQDEGRPFNQWDGEDTTAESLAPWNTFNSNILDPDLLGLFPEIAAVTDEKHAFPEDRPEPNLSESFRSNTGIIVHGFPHTCSKPSQWNSHNRVQSSADWIEHNMQISRVQGGLIESQSALEWRTEAESMTGFRFFAGMTGTEQQGNMLCSGIQSPSFSQPLYDFPTGQDELLEKTTATSNGIGTYPDPGEGFSIKPDAVNSNVEGDAHLHQVSDIFELFGDDITNPHYNFPNSGESDHGLPAGEETLGSLHLDVNNRDGTLTQLAYTPDTEWTLDNFTNPF